MKHTLKWFKNRIGKKVYRDKIDFCKCSMCQKQEVPIESDFDAEYMYMVQYDLDIDYRDKL